jgi:hypothetical protein
MTRKVPQGVRPRFMSIAFYDGVVEMTTVNPTADQAD